MIYSLSDLLKNPKTQDLVKVLIDEFTCPQNSDVEQFLKVKAIDCQWFYGTASLFFIII